MLIHSPVSFDTKDLLMLSTAAVVMMTSAVCTATALHTRAQSKIAAARRALTEALAPLARLQRVGHTAAAAPPSPSLGAPSDRRQFYLASALAALNQKGLQAASHEYVLVATMLLESGRTGEALKYYALGHDQAVGHFERATVQRAYGLALIAAGELHRGRRELVAAAKTFSELSRKSNFAHDAMALQAFATHQLLIEVELEKQICENAGHDLGQLYEVLATLTDGPSARAAKSVVAALTARVAEARSLPHGPSSAEVKPPEPGFAEEVSADRDAASEPIDLANAKGRRRGDLMLVSG